MSTSNNDNSNSNSKPAAADTSQVNPSNIKKRKSEEFTGEFWSLDGDDDEDPFSDLVVVVKSKATSEDVGGEGGGDDENNVKITIHGTYHVHRSKLGRQSGFFDRLLRGGFAESKSSDHVEIFLHPSAAPHFDKILDFMYGAWEQKQIPSPAVTVAHIADYLEIPGIYDKTMDQVEQLSDMSSLNEYMAYAKVLGTADLKTQIVKRCIGKVWHGTSLETRCPSIDLMEACLDYIGDGSNAEEISNSHPFLDAMDGFLFCTEVDDIPKNIYDRLVEQPAGNWEAKNVVEVYADHTWKKIPTKLLILREKFDPSSTTSAPLTSVEKECVYTIVSKLKTLNQEKKMELLEGLSKRILYVISCVASGGCSVDDF